MKKIKLSIIMVVKNGLPFIKDALDSYKKQIYRDKELIIVCSPSSDGTEKFLLNLKNKNKYKIFFDNKSKNKFGSLNKGISLAKGHYVGILHSDDIFYSSNVLKDVSKKIKQTNCDFIYGDCVFVNKKNSKIVREWKSGKFYKNKLKYGWMPPHTTTFVDRKLLKKDKYNLNYRISGDYEFLLRILNKDLKISYIKKRICKMRIGGDSTNFKNIFFKLNEDFKIASKYFNFPLITIFFKIIQKVNQFKIF
tara:strand:+ start:73 stop:822 length:750 start_codon:yes stop_codon:yes gene_type:complete